MALRTESNKASPGKGFLKRSGETVCLRNGIEKALFDISKTWQSKLLKNVQHYLYCTFGNFEIVLVVS